MVRDALDYQKLVTSHPPHTGTSDAPQGVVNILANSQSAQGQGDAGKRFGYGQASALQWLPLILRASTY
jgi:hypothetical protein